MKTLSAVARDALARFEGDPSLERRFSGGDGEFELTQYNSGKWGWKFPNGKVVGPYPANNAGKKAAKEDMNREKSRSGDSLSAAARDALDAGGAVFEEDGGMWYCSWNGATYGPFPNRAAAMQRRMEVSSANANGRDSLADLVDRARGGIREQTGDTFVEFDKKGGKIKIPSEADRYVEAEAKKLGLWDGKSYDFPSFTIYNDKGEEIGGG